MLFYFILFLWLQATFENGIDLVSDLFFKLPHYVHSDTGFYLRECWYGRDSQDTAYGSYHHHRYNHNCTSSLSSSRKISLPIISDWRPPIKANFGVTCTPFGKKSFLLAIASLKFFNGIPIYPKRKVVHSIFLRVKYKATTWWEDDRDEASLTTIN